jgi:hypothetical protein
MKLVRLLLVVCMTWHALAGVSSAEAGQYLVGAGRYDITGPAAESAYLV